MSFFLYNRRYVGSKYKISDWLREKILTNTDGKSFFDVFAGTGSMAFKMLGDFERIVLNDFLYSNEVIYKAFFLQQDFDLDKLKKIADEINSKKKCGKNYFSNNFADKYFGNNDSRKIGYTRELIKNLHKNNQINNKEFVILLASLIFSSDRIANTVGHYDAYIKKEIKDGLFAFSLISPIAHNTQIEIYREDANTLAKKIEADIAFVDPPYNSRQYSRFYHVLENLTQWKKPQLYGTALKPMPENMSGYCNAIAPKLFSDLVKTLHSKYICVTYNNTYNPKSSSSKNKISYEQILSSLEEVGETKIFSIGHKFFNAGKTSFKDHQEFLFITRVFSK